MAKGKPYRNLGVKKGCRSMLAPHAAISAVDLLTNSRRDA